MLSDRILEKPKLNDYFSYTSCDIIAIHRYFALLLVDGIIRIFNFQNICITIEIFSSSHPEVVVIVVVLIITVVILTILNSNMSHLILLQYYFKRTIITLSMNVKRNEMLYICRYKSACPLLIFYENVSNTYIISTNTLKICFD